MSTIPFGVRSEEGACSPPSPSSAPDALPNSPASTLPGSPPAPLSGSAWRASTPLRTTAYAAPQPQPPPQQLCGLGLLDKQGAPLAILELFGGGPRLSVEAVESSPLLPSPPMPGGPAPASDGGTWWRPVLRALGMAGSPPQQEVHEQIDRLLGDVEALLGAGDAATAATLYGALLGICARHHLAPLDSFFVASARHQDPLMLVLRQQHDLALPATLLRQLPHEASAVAVLRRQRPEYFTELALALRRRGRAVRDALEARDDAVAVRRIDELETLRVAAAQSLGPVEEIGAHVLGAGCGGRLVDLADRQGCPRSRTSLLRRCPVGRTGWFEAVKKQIVRDVAAGQTAQALQRVKRTKQVLRAAKVDALKFDVGRAWVGIVRALGCFDEKNAATEGPGWTFRLNVLHPAADAWFPLAQAFGLTFSHVELQGSRVVREGDGAAFVAGEVVLRPWLATTRPAGELPVLLGYALSLPPAAKAGTSWDLALDSATAEVLAWALARAEPGGCGRSIGLGPTSLGGPASSSVSGGRGLQSLHERSALTFLHGLRSRGRLIAPDLAPLALNKAIAARLPPELSRWLLDCADTSGPA